MTYGMSAIKELSVMVWISKEYLQSYCQKCYKFWFFAQFNFIFMCGFFFSFFFRIWMIHVYFVSQVSLFFFVFIWYTCKHSLILPINLFCFPALKTDVCCLMVSLLLGDKDSLYFVDEVRIEILLVCPVPQFVLNTIHLITSKCGSTFRGWS